MDKYLVLTWISIETNGFRKNKIHPNNSKCDWTLKMQYSIKLKG